MTRKHRGKWITSIIVLSLSLIFTVACSSEKAATNDKGTKKDTKTTDNLTPQTGGTITIGIPGEPDTLDVQKTVMQYSNDITEAIGGTLLAVDPDTNKIVPSLAESYDVSDDGKTITLKIRKDVKFHDGMPLTAKAVKETFDRILNPDTGALIGSFLAGVAAVEAPDDETFIIKLDAPSAPLLSYLTMGSLQPLSVDAIQKAGDDYGRNPVGAGPWKFKEWATGQSVTLVRNEDYNWPPSFYKNKGKSYPDKLVYKIITDPQTMLAALDSGSIDILEGAQPKDVKRYRDNDKFEVLDEDLQGIGLFIEMNLKNAILKDVNVRKAINLAINKDAFIKAVLDGEGTPAYGPLPSTIFGYDPKVKDYGYKYNKGEATKVLEDAGYSKNGKGIMEKDGKPLSFDLSIMSTQSQAAQLVQAMLKDIGINIEIKTLETATLIEKASKGDYDLSFLSYGYNDPDILFLLFHSSQIGGLNQIQVKNPELDKLLEEGKTTTDFEKRKQIYADVQKIVVDNAYWAPIYTPKVFYIVNKRVHGAVLKGNRLYLHDSWVSQ